MENKRLTLNGIDGFLSGKWVMSPITIPFIPLNDTSIKFNSTGVCILKIYSPPKNEILTVSTDITDIDKTKGKVLWLAYDKNNVLLTLDDSIKLTKTFSLPSQTHYVEIRLESRSSSGVTFEKPILVKGSTPIPYEPKKGSVMVEPRVKGKNLFDFKRYSHAYVSIIDNGYLITSYANYLVANHLITLEPNTTYTFSCEVNGLGKSGAYGRVSLYDGTNFIHMNVGGETGKLTNSFTTPTNIKGYQAIYIYGSSDNQPIEIKGIQLEEGTTATPYEPYKVQLNKHAKRNLPNLR